MIEDFIVVNVWVNGTSGERNETRMKSFNSNDITSMVETSDHMVKLGLFNKVPFVINEDFKTLILRLKQGTVFPNE